MKDLNGRLSKLENAVCPNRKTTIVISYPKKTFFSLFSESEVDKLKKEGRTEEEGDNILMSTDY